MSQCPVYCNSDSKSSSVSSPYLLTPPFSKIDPANAGASAAAALSPFSQPADGQVPQSVGVGGGGARHAHLPNQARGGVVATFVCGDGDFRSKHRPRG